MDLIELSLPAAEASAVAAAHSRARTCVAHACAQSVGVCGGEILISTGQPQEIRADIAGGIEKILSEC